MQNIMPPGLMEDTSKKATKGNSDGWPDFMPNRLPSGSSEEFRLLGTYSSGNAGVLWRLAQERMTPDGELKFAGYGFFSEYPEPSANDGAREVDWSNPARPKIEGSYSKPKRALVWIAWSYERQRPELLIIEQKTLRDQLVECMSDSDYGFSEEGIANFQIKISRKGAGLETSYGLMPKSKDASAEVVAAFAEIKDSAQVAGLTDGRHPLVQKKAFSSTGATAEVSVEDF